MKKLMAVAAALVAMSGAAFAQAVSAWNQLLLDPINVTDNSDTNFGMLRERMHATVSADRFSAEARYQAMLTSNGKWFEDGANLTQTALKANIYVRPVDGLELILGNDYDRHIPGTYRTDAADDYSANGRGRESYIGVAQFGSDGFGVMFTGVENLMLGLTVPGNQNWGKNGNLGLNFGVGYTIAPVALDLGAVVQTRLIGTNDVDLGFYVNWGGLEGLRLGAGYTAFNNVKEHDIAVVVGYDLSAIGFEVAFDYNTSDKSFQADGGFKGAIGDAANWYVRALYNNGGNADTYELNIKPGVICTLGNHELEAAVKFDLYTGNKFGMQIPLIWTYHFN